MTRESCPVCERMGRVTVTVNGYLTTTRCPNCNGEGEIEFHDGDDCLTCIASRVGSYPLTLEGLSHA